MRHPLDRSPRVVKIHLWVLEGKKHHRCTRCELVVPQHAIGYKSLPICRPDGGNDGYCVARAPCWLARGTTATNGLITPAIACGVALPPKLPRPGYELPEIQLPARRH